MSNINRFDNHTINCYFYWIIIYLILGNSMQMLDSQKLVHRNTWLNKIWNIL